MRTTINLSVIILVLAAWAAALPIPNPTGPEVRANGASFNSFLFSSCLTIPPNLFLRVALLFFSFSCSWYRPKPPIIAASAGRRKLLQLPWLWLILTQLANLNHDSRGTARIFNRHVPL